MKESELSVSTSKALSSGLSIYFSRGLRVDLLTALRNYYHPSNSHCVPTGAERSDPDEPVRSLYDAVKPKLYYAYDRYADAYLPMPT